MSILDDKPLAGRVALVTGSTRNIGRAIALTLARAGASVVVNGRADQAALESTTAEVRDLGVEAFGLLADVGDPEAVDELASRSLDRFGHIDIAVSNVAQRIHKPYRDIGLEDWHAIFATNLHSHFYLSRRVLPGMVERQWGRILHISGYDGFMAHASERAHNIACKAGAHGLAKAIAREYGHHGITANTIVPGLVDTERDPAQYPGIEERKRQVIAATCVKRLGTVQDVADACLFLASDSAGFITGVALHVNGGEYMV